MRTLRPLQEWMQACILDAANPPDATAVRKRILPSKTLTATERLDIYRGMYELRLTDALRIDYPGLLHCLGEEKFEELATLYVRHHPSRSYTLNRLGDHLPDFIAQVEGLPRAAFLQALARFELAETLVFDEDAPNRDAATSPDAGTRLEPIPALRTLTLDYPVHLYLKQQTAIPRRKNTHLIVYRKELAVQHLELNVKSMRLFRALCSGQPIGEAVAASRLDDQALFDCFRDWFGEKLFLPCPL